MFDLSADLIAVQADAQVPFAIVNLNVPMVGQARMGPVLDPDPPLGINEARLAPFETAFLSII